MGSRKGTGFTKAHCADVGTVTIRYTEHLRFGIGWRLWVRENFAEINDHNFSVEGYQYQADGNGLISCAKGRWKPSIHMPRWASRILLEVVGVHVERVCEADDTSIMREGIQKCTKDGELYKYGLDEWPWSEWCLSPLEAWRKLWIQINGHESWDANPLVWVIEYRRVA